MPFYKFGPSDLLVNTIKAHPQFEFVVYDGKIYLNDMPHISGGQDFSSSLHIPTGHVSLYELNVDRSSSLHGYNTAKADVHNSSKGSTFVDSDGGVATMIYPFIPKNQFDKFGTVTMGTSVSSATKQGDIISGTYPLSASIVRTYYATSADRPHITALQNTLNYYKPLSKFYDYSNYTGSIVNMISIPSILYGSSIKKGSVNLKIYVTGTLVGQLSDKNRNGELIQVSGATPDPAWSGTTSPYPLTDRGHAVDSNAIPHVGGVVLYNEGIILLTGSWSVAAPTTITEAYTGAGALSAGWIYFAAGANDGITSINSSSFSLEYEGTTFTPVKTMMVHAKKGHLNHSNNPTYIKSGSYVVSSTGSSGYFENEDIEIKNIVSSSYDNYDNTFDKITYISKIGIFDKNKNLIAVAKLATPVRKREEDEFTFKLKLDV